MLPCAACAAAVQGRQPAVPTGSLRPLGLRCYLSPFDRDAAAELDMSRSWA